jgi:hypothetical protein
MKASHVRLRHGLAVASSLFLICLANTAFAARSAASEVGHWLGFAHSSGGPGNIVLDLAPSVSTSGMVFQGTISGLPAVQNTLNVVGSVTSDGVIILVCRDVSTGAIVGFCDGSVFPILNFGPVGSQDDLGSLNFALLSPTGAQITGHMNLLHMAGGLRWQQAGMDWGGLGGFPPDPCDGSFLREGADTSEIATLSAVQDTTGSQAGSPNLNSAITGEMKLSLLPLAMVGTVNSRGSIVMMCDGSAPSGALIGLLFTGGVTPVPLGSPGRMVGGFGAGGFASFLPAVQRSRDGSMSFFWNAPIGTAAP